MDARLSFKEFIDVPMQEQHAPHATLTLIERLAGSQALTTGSASGARA